MKTNPLKKIENRIAELEWYITNNMSADDWHEKVREMNALSLKRDVMNGMYKVKKDETFGVFEYDLNANKIK